jgi:hypothetical protein
MGMHDEAVPHHTWCTMTKEIPVFLSLFSFFPLLFFFTSFPPLLFFARVLKNHFEKRIETKTMRISIILHNSKKEGKERGRKEIAIDSIVDCDSGSDRL